MTVYQEEKEDLLLLTEVNQMGSWELRSTTTSAGRRMNLQSYIVHACNLIGEKRYWWDLNILEDPCVGCEKHPPMKIMTLWKLHNFDYIQNGGDR